MNRLLSATRWTRIGLSPHRNVRALWTTFNQILRYRELLREMVDRDLSASHARHGLGGLWVYVHPLVIVGTYLLIFGFVLGNRLVTGDFPGDFPAYILAGLAPWLMMQAALVRGPGALIGSANLVKQVVFPIEILPVAAMIAATIPYLPALALVIIYNSLVGGGPSWMLLCLPAVLVMHAILAIGMSFALSAITPFFRDLREIVTVFTSIAMYLMPTVYLPDWMPRVLRPMIYSNPFSYVVWVYQDVLFFGEFRHPYAWAIMLLFALLGLGIGYRTFERLKPYYGNAL